MHTGESASAGTAATMPTGGTWSAPGRVNLIGEHTDYNGGFVLPFAIDARTRCDATVNSDSVLRVTSTAEDTSHEVPVEAVDTATFAGWSGYALGMAWAFTQMGIDLSGRPGIDIVISSDVPVGAGLSSSAAIESAVGSALNDLWGLGLSATDLARAGQIAENGAVGAPTGIMDQMASMLGRGDHAVLLDCASLTPTLVPLHFAQAGLALLVLDSQVRHAHADGGYGSRRASCEQGAAAMGVASLRELSTEDLGRAQQELDDVTFRRVRHVITENQRVLDAVEVIAAHGPAAMGDLLVASHASMRDDFEISIPAIDTAVQACLDAGALGARLTGGGFGGSSIALVRCDDADRVAEAASAACTAAGHPSPRVLTVTPSAGARRDH